MKKFEYNIQAVHSAEIEDILATLGSQGWELVSVALLRDQTLKNGAQDFFFSIFLKRELNLS